MKILASLCLIILGYYYLTKPKFVPHEVLAAPLQTELPSTLILKTPSQKYIFKSNHAYEIVAMIVSRDRYRFDRLSEISPVDFALAWGPLTLENNLKNISYSQSGRWYSFRYQDDDKLDIDQRDIEQNSSNHHIIPDLNSPSLRDKILSFNEGQIVKLKGYLVNVTADNGLIWNTSITRDDTGGGACEIFYVTEAMTYY
jgi:hypothetical protein